MLSFLPHSKIKFDVETLTQEAEVQSLILDQLPFICCDLFSFSRCIAVPPSLSIDLQHLVIWCGRILSSLMV